MGVLEHENDTMTFYRSFHNVSKNSNFTIYCLSRQLEKWKNQFNRYPEEVFIQIDGGSENANQFVLAYLELLVARGLTKQIYYTRLPTRHTHEDIDAIFGVVWRWFKKQHTLSISAFKLGLEECLAGTKYDVAVEDVLIVPNYASFLKDYIYPIESLHKLENTQHQWRFESIHVDAARIPGV